jgi:hypothetical protein
MAHVVSKLTRLGVSVGNRQINNVKLYNVGEKYDLKGPH